MQEDTTDRISINIEFDLSGLPAPARAPLIGQIASRLQERSLPGLNQEIVSLLQAQGLDLDIFGLSVSMEGALEPLKKERSPAGPEAMGPAGPGDPGRYPAKKSGD